MTQTQTWPTSRMLFSTALGIFVLTIVIGILNGTDLLVPNHATLITHVHAGTLGWITLAVTGAAIWMFTEGRLLSESETRAAQSLGVAMLASISVYIVAFWMGGWGELPVGSLHRPIGGSLVFLAVTWGLVWVVRQARRTSLTVPHFALLLAWFSLFTGAVFGVILGIFSARGEVPGLSTETASGISEAHPATMVGAYLFLAGLGIAEWLLRSEHRPLARSWAGIVQVLAFFLAGVAVTVGVILDNDGLVQLLVPLQTIGIVIFVVRLWPELKPRAWRLDRNLFFRLGVLGLIAGVGFLAYIISGLTSGRYEEFEDIPLNIVIAFDHVNFIGVMTNLMFGLIASALPGIRDRLVQWVLWGVNVGFVTFIVGLVLDSAPLKRIGTPVMGAALLAGIWVFLRGLRQTVPQAQALAGAP